MPESETIDASEETIRIGLMFGLMEWNVRRKVHVLTPKGSDYLRGWIDEKIEEHGLEDH